MHTGSLSTGGQPLMAGESDLEQVSARRFKSEPAPTTFRRRSQKVVCLVKLSKIRAPLPGRAPSIHHAPTQHSFLEGTKELLSGNKLYWLLVLVPPAIFAPHIGLSDGVSFALSCVAILPLAGLLGDVTEQVAMHTNDTLSGLLNATFGNATEVIVSYFALQRGLLSVVQVSLLGSVLSNTLLVLGCAFLAGGLAAKDGDPKFNKVAAVSNSTLLQIAILGLMVPTAMEGVGAMELGSSVDLVLSRGISCCLLLLYVLYCYFQLFSHRHLFEDEADDEEDGDDESLLSLNGGLAWLAVATVLISVLSENLTGTLEAASEQWGLTKAFVGFVILPIVGNAAEHTTAIVMASKNKMDLALGVALGSSTQIALFVIPLMVLLGAAIGQPLDLFFGTFETIVTVMTSLIVFFVVQNGQTNYLEGIMLLMSYAIICFAFFFYVRPVKA